MFGKTTAASTGFSLTGASSAAPTFQLGGGLASNTTGFGLNTTTTTSSTDRSLIIFKLFFNVSFGQND